MNPDLDFSESGLQQLRQTYEDDGAIEIVDALLAELPRQREEMTHNLLMGIAKSVQRGAHDIKSGSNLLQAKALGQFCLEMEELASLGRLGEVKKGVPEMFERYETLLKRARAALPNQA